MSPTIVAAIDSCDAFFIVVEVEDGTGRELGDDPSEEDGRENR